MLHEFEGTPRTRLRTLSVPRAGRGAAKAGFGLATVAFLGVLALLAVGSFQYTSRSSYRGLKQMEKRVQAQYLAESAMTAAAAAIFQNDFKSRWYRQRPGRYGGYYGEWAGTYGEGSFTVVAEDIVKSTVKEDDEKSVKEATYNRIDVFSKGTCAGYSVVLYQALVLMPEEPVYEAVPTGDSVRYAVR